MVAHPEGHIRQMHQGDSLHPGLVLLIVQFDRVHQVGVGLFVFALIDQCCPVGQFGHRQTQVKTYPLGHFHGFPASLGRGHQVA